TSSATQTGSRKRRWPSKSGRTATSSSSKEPPRVSSIRGRSWALPGGRHTPSTWGNQGFTREGERPRSGREIGESPSLGGWWRRALPIARRGPQGQVQGSAARIAQYEDGIPRAAAFQ